MAGSEPGEMIVRMRDVMATENWGRLKENTFARSLPLVQLTAC